MSTAPASFAPLPATRDPRIDIARGIALAMIFINHIPAQNWSLLTLRNWGLADSAEVFVLLAGVAAGLAYGRFFDRGEIRQGLAKVGGRMFTLYFTHLLLFLGVGIACVIGAEVFNETYTLEALGFDTVLNQPLAFVGHVLTLTFLPNYLDILPLYVLLLGALPLLFMLDRVHLLAPLALSMALYALAQVLPINLPNMREAREWFFNPFAWQLLFTIGFTLARMTRRGLTVATLMRPLARRMITLLAGAYVLVMLVIAAPWRNFAGFENAILINPADFGAIAKSTLHPLRLLDILAKLWLVLVIVPAGAGWLNGRWLRPFALMGKHALEVFAFATLGAVIASIIINIGGFASSLVAMSVIGGVSMMAALAFGLEHRKRAARQAKAAPQPLAAAALAKTGGA